MVDLKRTRPPRSVAKRHTVAINPALMSLRVYRKLWYRQRHTRVPIVLYNIFQFPEVIHRFTSAIARKAHSPDYGRHWLQAFNEEAYAKNAPLPDFNRVVASR